MSRKTPLLQSSGRYFHAFNRGVNREPIFFREQDYRLFTRLIQQSLSGIQFVILNYALMPNHFHFTVRQDTPYAMATFFQRLCDKYAKTINFIEGRVGHLFQGGYQPIPIDAPRDLYTLSRYIHLNPVAAHLVSNPNDWEFSSCREYCGLRESSFVDPSIIIEPMGGTNGYHENLMLGEGDQSILNLLKED